MANIKFIDPVKEIAGTLNKGENLHFRTRNGKTQAYIVKNPYNGLATEKQTLARNKFAELAKQTKEILLDNNQKSLWEIKYNKYKKDAEAHPFKYKKLYTTLRGFIIAQLADKQ